MGKNKRKGTRGGDESQAVSLQMDRLWRPVFDEFDQDRDGRICLDEFKYFVKTGNAHLRDLPPEILEEIIERSDWDQNRYIDFDEFLRMVNAREVAALHPHLHQIIRYAAAAVVPKSRRQTAVNSYIQQYNCAPPPIFILLISIIEVAAYVYYCVELKEFSATGPVPFNSPLIYNPYRRFEAWRYLTYALIHAGFIHVFFNIIVQLTLGIPLEMIHKWWRVAIVYLSGVLAGSMGASITDPTSYLAGASGGVYALISAHLATVILNFKEMEFGWVRLIALIFFGATDIGVAVWDRYTAKQNRTSYAAHVAGAVAGLLVGIVVLRNLRVRRWETILGYFAILTYVLMMGAIIMFNVLNPDYFLKREAEADNYPYPQPLP